MKRYKVLKDFKGSPDGAHVVEYTEGQEVELTASLAEAVLAEGWVEEVAVDDEAAKAEAEAQAKAEAERQAKREKLQGEIAKLEASMEKAKEAGKAAIKAKIDAKRQELDALN